ncbi:MAG TPA: YbhB/YbcL family Raf kinase inhibitor-like protein [Gemmatimonadales bacterium]|nr:YbhB/YbcL family Raf kinase inhibitor-like protein [Gemmatimonadales bacterium]
MTRGIVAAGLAGAIAAATGGPLTLTLKSPAFENGAAIPAAFTCDGADRSPALAWSGGPKETRSFALIMDDPDAPRGTWVHWVLYHLPATVAGLPENVATTAELPALGGARQGNNSWPRIGYGGPCPPPGKPHRYFFKLYALDVGLDLAPGATKADLERAMQGHVRASAELFGTYQRKQ